MPHQSGHQKEDELGWYMEGGVNEVADILAEFAQELRRGDVNVWKGQRELHLSPEGKISFRVEAVVDTDGQQGLHMKLHWYDTSAADDLSGAANRGE